MEDQEYLDRKHQDYLDRRAELIRVREVAVDSHDKALLQISAAGLPLLSSFASKFYIPGYRITYWAVWITLALLAMVAIVTLLNFSASKKNAKFKLDELDERYRDFLTTRQEKPEAKSKHKALAEWSSTLALFLLVLAFAVFGFDAIYVAVHHKII